MSGWRLAPFPVRRTSAVVIVAALLAVTLPVLAVACQPSPPQAAAGGEPTIIASDDGQATLQVPPGALPEGVSLRDLRITRVEPRDLPVDLEGEDILAAYRLEPDGLQFLAPATIVFEFEASDDGVPIPLHVTGGGEVEAFEEVSIEVNLTEGSGSVAAEISHFSWVSYARYFEATLEVGPSYLVGDSFTASASIGLKEDPMRHASRPREEQTLYLFGSFELFPAGRIAPRRIPNAPPLTLVNVGSRFIAPGTFTCQGPGEGRVLYEARVWYRYSVPPPPPSLLDRFLSSFQPAPRPDFLNIYRFTLYAWTECREAAHPLPTPPGVDIRATPTPPTALQPTPTPLPARDSPPLAVVPGDGDTVPVSVLVIDGEHYPVEQFITALPDACDAEHYHGPVVRSLEGTIRRDPNPPGCGHGLTSEIPHATVPWPQHQYEEFQEWKRANP